MRTIDQWEEYRDTAAKLLFYYNVDNDEYSWRKPRIVLQEEQLTFGEEVAGETIDDWERAQRKAQSLRKVAGWEECRHIDTGTIFYFSLQGMGGSWEKPPKFAKAERRQYGWELFHDQGEADWDRPEQARDEA